MASYSRGEKVSQVTLSPRVSRKGNHASSPREGDGYNKLREERQQVAGRKGPGQGRILETASKAATCPFSPAPGMGPTIADSGEPTPPSTTGREYQTANTVPPFMEERLPKRGTTGRLKALALRVSREGTGACPWATLVAGYFRVAVAARKGDARRYPVTSRVRVRPLARPSWCPGRRRACGPPQWRAFFGRVPASRCRSGEGPRCRRGLPGKGPRLAAGGGRRCRIFAAGVYPLSRK
jgi:hypothetical protein